MIKTVNIIAKSPITTINPPIYGTIKNIKMSTGDILRCLSMRGIVEEVMPDGSTIKLNMTNYYVDNVAKWNQDHLPITNNNTVVLSDSINLKESVKIIRHNDGVPNNVEEVLPKKVDKVPDTPKVEIPEIPVVETADPVEEEAECDSQEDDEPSKNEPSIPSNIIRKKR